LKHNGAIEKTLVGLTCLGEALLRSGDARLSRQPREWLASLFERTTRPEQDVRDLIRRSAGIPFGFMAVFLAEPRGVPRTLLHEALEKLLDLAVRGLFFSSRASLSRLFFVVFFVETRPPLLATNKKRRL
jgi:thyroid adenoma-associated protein